MSEASAERPRIDVTLPDLARFAAGNAGLPYVWQFQGERAGPRGSRGEASSSPVT